MTEIVEKIIFVLIIAFYGLLIALFLHGVYDFIKKQKHLTPIPVYYLIIAIVFGLGAIIYQEKRKEEQLEAVRQEITWLGRSMAVYKTPPDESFNPVLQLYQDACSNDPACSATYDKKQEAQDAIEEIRAKLDLLEKRLEQ